jgi:hypothetical protein
MGLRFHGSLHPKSANQHEAPPGRCQHQTLGVNPSATDLFATTTPAPARTPPQPPTVTLSPTTTVLPTPLCPLSASLARDVTLPNDSVVEPGAPFDKTWLMRNSETCAWAAGRAGGGAFACTDRVRGGEAGAVRLIAQEVDGDPETNAAYVIAPNLKTSNQLLRLIYRHLQEKTSVTRVAVPNEASKPAASNCPSGRLHTRVLAIISWDST